jgi:hypothetical protein
MAVILFIAFLFVSSPATTTPAPSTGGAEATSSSTTDVPCTAENPDPNESCNIVWGS